MEYFLDIRQPNNIIGLDDLYNFIKDNNILFGKIYLYNVQEPVWPRDKKINFTIDVDVSNIELVFTIGHYVDTLLIEKVFGKFKKITVKSYPYFWLARSLCELYQAQNINKNPYAETSYQFIKLYTLWINEFRNNRRKMIDSLIDNKLKKYGFIKLHKLRNTNKNSYRKISIPLHYVDPNCSRWILGDTWYNSLIQIVTESRATKLDNNDIYISEKTAYPILMNKLFITLGAPGYYDHLQNMGFKLYTIFDYAFDKVEDEEQRIHQIVKQLVRLRNKNYNKLYDSCKADILYNNQKLIEIIQNSDTQINYSEKEDWTADCLNSSIKFYGKNI